MYKSYSDACEENNVLHGKTSNLFLIALINNNNGIVIRTIVVAYEWTSFGRFEIHGFPFRGSRDVVHGGQQQTNENPVRCL